MLMVYNGILMENIRIYFFSRVSLNLFAITLSQYKFIGMSLEKTKLLESTDCTPWGASCPIDILW